MAVPTLWDRGVRDHGCAMSPRPASGWAGAGSVSIPLLSSLPLFPPSLPPSLPAHSSPSTHSPLRTLPPRRCSTGVSRRAAAGPCCITTQVGVGGVWDLFYNKFSEVGWLARNLLVFVSNRLRNKTEPNVEECTRMKSGFGAHFHWVLVTLRHRPDQGK